jgi:hypothetical protein
VLYGAASPRCKAFSANDIRIAASLLLFHRRSAAFDCAGAAFGNDHLRSAFAAEIELSELICHRQFLNASWNF